MYRSPECLHFAIQKKTMEMKLFLSACKLKSLEQKAIFDKLFCFVSGFVAVSIKQ